jgi:hypothetical protein
MTCDRCQLQFKEDDLEYYEPTNEYLCRPCEQDQIAEDEPESVTERGH